MALLTLLVWAMSVPYKDFHKLSSCGQEGLQRAGYVGREQCNVSAAPGTCYFKGSKCLFYAFLVCTDCCYGDSGGLDREKSYPCGICIGGDFN